MATLRSLNINIRAGVANLSSDFQKANSLVGKFQHAASSEFKKLTGSIFNVKTAIVGLIGSAGFGMLLKSSFDNVDALAKMSDKLGFSTQAMAGLEHAAGLAGVNNQKLNISLVTMQKNIGDLYSGLGQSKLAFAGLNLSVESLKGLKPEEQFKLIADRIAGIKDKTERANIAYRIFGQNGVDLINVMQDGAKGIDEAIKEAIKLGIALNRVDAAKIEMANDAFTRAKEAIQGVSNKIAVSLAPYLKVAADWFTELVKRNNGFGMAVLNGFEYATKAVGFFGDMMRGLHVVFKGVEVIGLGFISGLLTAFDSLNQGVADVINKLITSITGPLVTILNKLAPFSDTAKNLAESLKGLSITPSPALSKWADESRQALVKAEAELFTLINTPMPSKNIEAWFAKLKKRAEEAAKIIANGVANPKPTDIPMGFDKSSYDNLVKSLYTQEQAVNDSYQRRAQIVGNALKAGVIDQKEATKTLLLLDKKYQSDRLAAEIQSDAAIKTARASVLNNAVQLLDQFAGKSKIAALASLAIQKALAISETMINTHVAAVRALAELGPIAGPGAAASIEAYGSASVALIAATGLLQAKSISAPKGYAKGGIVNGPTVLVGEAGPEAIVPLPDGRSIPVKMDTQNMGTSSVTNNYTINAVDAPSFQRLVVSNPEAVALAVQTIYNRKARSGGPYR